MQNRKLWIGATWLVLIAALGIAQAGLEKTAAAQGASKPQGPLFEVDPLWPKPLPNHWLLGSTIGVWADDQDHIWIIHRSSATLDANERGAELKPPTYECCVGAPPVLEFDQEGNLVRQLGRSRTRLRVAGLEPRHLRRSRWERVDCREWRTRRPHPEIHQGRQVPRPVRQEGRPPRAAGQPPGAEERPGAPTATIPPTSAGPPRSSSTPRPTRPTLPTAI